MPTTDEDCAFVKVRFTGERRFLFLAPGGRTTSKRIRAAMFPTRAQGIAAANDQLEHGAEYGVVAVTVMQSGRRVHHAGQPTPPPPAPKYGPQAGYRYLVAVTKTGRAVFHITDEDGRFTDFTEDAYETCAAEARRAGADATGAGRYNVHASRCLLITRGVKFTQRTADGRSCS